MRRESEERAEDDPMKPLSGRKWGIIFVILVVLIGLVIFTWISFQWQKETRASERHDLSYSIELSVNTTIDNVTLLVPVPELNRTPLLAGSFVNGTGYGMPKDWNFSIVIIQGAPMLSITASKIIPEYHGYPIPIELGKTPEQTPVPMTTEYSIETPVLTPIVCVVIESRPGTIDTRNPVGREPVFFPEEQFTPMTGTSNGFQGVKYLHNVPLYITYTSDRPANLSIRVAIEGVNSIWRGGWLSNGYSDSVFLVLNSSTQGWVESEGTLVTGEGVYY
jgi:hypothetical protein